MSKSPLKSKAVRLLSRKGFSTVEVSVEEDVINLSGSVESYEQFLSAGLLVGKKLKGVRGVVNELDYPGKRPFVKKSGPSEVIGKADVVIVGGGVTGAAIARELSKHKCSVVLVEKQADLSCGASKANNAMVHSGIGEKPGSLKQTLCVKGHFMFEEMAKDLGVEYEKNGLFIVLSKQSLKSVPLPQFLRDFFARFVVPFVIVRRGRRMGLPMEKISKKRLLAEEPMVTKEALVAVSSPSYGVTSPYEWTIALAENAVQNGVKVLLDAEVVDVLVEDGMVCGVKTSKGVIESRFVVNAAGVYADWIAELAGDRFFSIHPRKGSIVLFDRTCCEHLSHNVTYLRLPSDKNTKGGGAMPLPVGNVIWGPTACEVFEREDKSVSKDDLDTIFHVFGHLLPSFPKKSVITYFAGVRAPTFTEDYVIEASRKVEGLVHVAGIQSPGLAASPAVAELAVDILAESGLVLEEDPGFDPIRKKGPVVRELSFEKRRELIAKNPLYGRVVCRCEGVTEGEIVDVINGIIPARSVDAIKRRVRAGMGRCQGGFCLPRVAEILMRETGCSVTEVLKDVAGSEVFVGPAKCLLKDKIPPNGGEK